VPRILNTPAGIIHSAANVDVAVRIPVLRVLMVAAAAGAVLALYQAVATCMVAHHHRCGALRRPGCGRIDGGRADASVHHRAERAGARDTVHRAECHEHYDDSSGAPSSWPPEI
jgi:hypothetical protein